MAGQDPYRPFENKRLKWQSPNSEVGGPALAPIDQDDFAALRKPAVLLFLSGKDQKNCCAANYERFIFRDQKVVKLSEKEFVTVRINRDGSKKETLKRYNVKRNLPALIITDCEGVISARYDLCTNAADVYKAMVRCLKTSRKKAKTTNTLIDKFEDADRLIKQEAWREAGVHLKKILRIKGGLAAGTLRANALLAQIEREGKVLFEQARHIASPTERFDEMLRLRHEFWNFDDLVTQIRPKIRELEEDESTKDIIWNFKGLKLIDEAQGLIERGKNAKGRTILRKVRKEYAGTEAAEKAEALLAEG